MSRRLGVIVSHDDGAAQVGELHSLGAAVAESMRAHRQLLTENTLLLGSQVSRVNYHLPQLFQQLGGRVSVH